MISVDSIPTSIKQDKNVTQYIMRSVELQTANPVVSYYCKLYVLDYILTNKIHQTSKEVEEFTIGLLDDTEALRSSHEDESVRKVLDSKQLSINLVFVFAFRLFNSCLEDLKVDGYDKKQLISKFRAALNFWSLLKVLYGDDESEIDYSATTAGKCSNKDEFVAFTKEKIKTLKYQLSKVIKEETPAKNEDQELAAELAKLEQPSADQGTPDLPEETNEGDDFTPEQPKESNDNEGEDFPSLALPGAPKFDPSDPAEDDGNLKLPGAPKFLPDDDLSQINRKSSIQVFKADSPEPETKLVPKVVAKPERKSEMTGSSQHHAPVTKEDIHTILDSTEHISKIQKHAKFAISALNYEDLDTAEAELTKGLEMIRLMKSYRK